MGSDQSPSHIDTLKLKATIVRKIGHRRAEKYFDHLTRLFSFKLSKCEFDKLCFRTIGRENIPIHNRLIRSIVKNACCSVRIGNVRKNDLQSLCGDASPRKVRSPVGRDRKPSSPLGKPQSMACRELVEIPTELLSLGSRPPIEVLSVEEGEEVEQEAGSPSVQSRTPVTAPLGISLSGACKNNSYYNLGTCKNSGELPDTRALRNRLEQKLEAERFSVSMDCVNLLNNGLDAYLRRVIEPCLVLAMSRSGNDPVSVPGCLNGILAARPIRASLLDFRSGMEMNPKLLGEDWPIQLEKISLPGNVD